MKYHKISKQIFYSEILVFFPESIALNSLDKYTMLSKTAKTVGEREIAKIVAKRYKDFLITIWHKID